MLRSPCRKLTYQRDYQNGLELPDSETMDTRLDPKYTAFNTPDSDGNMSAAIRNKWGPACKGEPRPNTSSATQTVHSTRTSSGDVDACTSQWTICLSSRKRRRADRHFGSTG